MNNQNFNSTTNNDSNTSSQFNLIDAAPVYTDARKLASALANLVFNRMPKTARILYGEMLVNSSVVIMKEITNAAARRDLNRRLDSLNAIVAEKETMETLIKILGDERKLSTKDEANLTFYLVGIGMQINSWRRKVINKIKEGEEES